MEKPREDDAETGELGFRNWGRPREHEAEGGEAGEAGAPQPPELQDGRDDDDDDEEPEEEAAGLRSEQRKLWHFFQASANAVAQLYRGSGCSGPEASPWGLFQSAAQALTGLYKESRAAQPAGFRLGEQVGCQRRDRDLLDWARSGPGTILREDLIAFLCGKAPPGPAPAGPPPPPPGLPKMAADSSSAPGSNLQPFQEAIDLHDLSGAMASVSVQGGPPSPPPAAGGLCSEAAGGDVLQGDLSSCSPEDLALRLASGGHHKRTPGPHADAVAQVPAHKRSRVV